MIVANKAKKVSLFYVILEFILQCKYLKKKKNAVIFQILFH